MPIPSFEEASQYVEEVFHQQLEWARQEFQKPDLNANLKITNTRTGPTGQARVNSKNQICVKINIFDLTQSNVICLLEYRSYARDPVIGSFDTDDWRLWISCTIAHELAHAVQFSFKMQGCNHPWFTGDSSILQFADLGEYEGKHGLFFQNIYKRFRKALINQHIQGFGCTNRYEFESVDDLEQRIASAEPVAIAGMTFVLRGDIYRIVGRNPQTTAKLYGFYVQNQNGHLYRIKLATLANQCPNIMARINQDPKLAAELDKNRLNIIKKKQANLKSSLTKRKRYTKAKI